MSLQHQTITIINTPSPLPLSSTTTSPKRLITTTKPALSNLTALFRMPTVQPKTKYMATCRVPCQQAPHDLQPPIMEKTCGLFNTVEATVTPEIDKLDLDMETNINFESYFNNVNNLGDLNPFSSSFNESSSSQQQQQQQQAAIATTTTITTSTAAAAAATANTCPKKTFTQKLNEANLSIKIIKPNNNININNNNNMAAANLDTLSLENLESPFGLDYDDSDLAKLITPSIEKIFDLIGSISPSISSPDLLKQQQSIPSARVATDEELLACIGIDEFQLQSIISSPPAAAAPTTTDNILLVPVPLQPPSQPPQPQPQVSSTSLNDTSCYDHAYSSRAAGVAAKRRRLSSDAFDEIAPSSVFSNASTNLDASMCSDTTWVEPSTSSGASNSKRQRTKGVYRARDVQTESDMANYRERREKNNISSKISRANKRNYYAEMEARCDNMSVENKQLNLKITKMEELNQLMKDFLKDAFTANLK